MQCCENQVPLKTGDKVILEIPGENEDCIGWAGGQMCLYKGTTAEICEYAGSITLKTSGPVDTYVVKTNDGREWYWDSRYMIPEPFAASFQTNTEINESAFMDVLIGE